MLQDLKIRYAAIKDLSGIVDIVNHYNKHGFSTFDDRQYSSDDKISWFEKFDKDSLYKLIVAVDKDQIVGYACSSMYRDAGVFAKTIETSVYVHPNYSGRGAGSKMYDFLFNELGKHALHRVVVGIALPNEASVALHRKFGFTEIGIFDEYARFKDQFFSSLWMQKALE